MRELTKTEVKKVNGGFIIVLAAIWATRHGNHNSSNMSAATNRL